MSSSKEVQVAGERSAENELTQTSFLPIIALLSIHFRNATLLLRFSVADTRLFLLSMGLSRTTEPP